MNIYLIGFMGTGKSTVGRALASRLGRVFADLDELIELKERRPITEIFAQEGEPYFRHAETAALTQVSREKNMVVACGGGIVTREENLRIMKDSGTVICLCADPETILARTRGMKHRPLLNVENPRERIESLLNARAPLYACAGNVIDTSSLTVEEAVAAAEKLVR
jgi:shikimate kinase